MKKTLFMFVALATFIVSAQAYAYTWTDFSKTRIKYRISGYSSADAAQAAAVQSLAGLEEGVLPSAHMFQSDRDKCRDINSSKSKRAIGKYIERRGKYSGVQSYGFRLTESFNSAGNPNYGAWIDARIPCLKKEKKDKEKKNDNVNQDDNF